MTEFLFIVCSFVALSFTFGFLGAGLVVMKARAGPHAFIPLCLGLLATLGLAAFTSAQCMSLGPRSSLHVLDVPATLSIPALLAGAFVAVGLGAARILLTAGGLAMVAGPCSAFVTVVGTGGGQSSVIPASLVLTFLPLAIGAIVAWLSTSESDTMPWETRLWDGP